MFGYVRPNLADMSQEAQARYRAHYCGLCHTIGDRHGQAARMTLTFDLAYLTIFLGSLYEPEEVSGEGRCVPHPVKKHAWVRSRVTDYAADMTIALTYHKLMDDWQDDRNIAAKGASAVLKKAYIRVKADWPRQCKTIERTLANLSQVEKRRDLSPDAAARCFGELMAELFVMQEDYWSGALRAFGYSLGRYIYLLDAACDADKDAKKGSYNPVLLMEKKPEDMRDTLEMVLGDASAAFEKLPLIQDEEILRNILYSGVWLGYNEYLHKKDKKMMKESEVKGHGE
ncbi:MAG: hypothetical protein E7318_10920 [Clostridiales bacterium]|nr:hypothetical protein [Clostridiales bacterium]